MPAMHCIIHYVYCIIYFTYMCVWLVVSRDLNWLRIFVWLYSFTFLSFMDPNKIQVPLITSSAKNFSSPALLCFPLSIRALLNFTRFCLLPHTFSTERFRHLRSSLTQYPVTTGTQGSRSHFNQVLLIFLRVHVFRFNIFVDQLGIYKYFWVIVKRSLFLQLSVKPINNDSGLMEFS